MLTRTEMFLVFVLREKITLGRYSNGDEIILNKVYIISDFTMNFIVNI